MATSPLVVSNPITNPLNTNLNPSLKINFLLWNIRGITDYHRFGKIQNWAKSLNTDFCGLTETHLDDSKHNKIFKRCKYKNEVSHYNTASRGCLLLNLTHNWSHHNTKKDTEGRVISVVVKLDTITLVIITTYAPNTQKEQLEFCEELKSLLNWLVE